MTANRRDLDMDLERLLEAIFPEPSDRDEWLRAPDPMLGGRTPQGEIDRGRTKRVVGVLSTLYSGAFT
jgi:hypothetical protein